MRLGMPKNKIRHYFLAVLRTDPRAAADSRLKVWSFAKALKHSSANETPLLHKDRDLQPLLTCSSSFPDSFTSRSSSSKLLLAPLSKLSHKPLNSHNKIFTRNIWSDVFSDTTSAIFRKSSCYKICYPSPYKSHGVSPLTKNPTCLLLFCTFSISSLNSRR